MDDTCDHAPTMLDAKNPTSTGYTITHVCWPFACVATPLWDKCEDETHTPKSGKLESFGTPENSELDYKGQNTSHWGCFLCHWKGLEV